MAPTPTPVQLIKAASDRKIATSSRIGALLQLQSVLLSPNGPSAVRPVGDSLWQSLCGLFLDRDFGVRQAAAIALGAFGVAAAAIPAGKSGGGSGGGGGLLLEWAMPLLVPSSRQEPSFSSLVLHALRVCIAHVPPPALGDYAARTAIACYQILESEETETALLGPALGALVVIVARDPGAVQPVFHDLVDVLLGWALDPSLPPELVDVIASGLENMGPLWAGDNGAFCLELVAKLMGDVRASATPAGAEGDRALLALLACLGAVGAGGRAGGARGLPPSGTWPAAAPLLAVLERARGGGGDTRMLAAALAALEAAVGGGSAPSSEVAAIAASPAVLALRGHSDARVASLAARAALVALTDGREEVGNLARSAAVSDLECRISILLPPAAAAASATDAPGALAAAQVAAEEQCLSDFELLARAFVERSADSSPPVPRNSTNRKVHRLEHSVGSTTGSGSVSIRRILAGEQSVEFSSEDEDEEEKGSTWVDVAEVAAAMVAPLALRPRLQLAALKLLRALQLVAPAAGGDIVAYLCTPAAPEVYSEVIRWACDLHTSSQGRGGHAALSPEVAQALTSAAGASADAAVREEAITALWRIAAGGAMAPAQVVALSAVAIDRLADSSDRVRRVARWALEACALPALWHGAGAGRQMGVSLQVGRGEAATWRELVRAQHAQHDGGAQHAQHDGGKLRFRTPQLAQLLSFFNLQPPPDDGAWVQRIRHQAKPLHAVTHSPLGPAGASLDSALAASSDAALWWAAENAAAHLVEARLRSHLGGATNTFAGVERVLRGGIASLRNEAEVGAGGSGPLPPVMLLAFVEALERGMYNAYEGCCGLPPPGPAAELFFRTNRKVCEDWFSRVRGPVLQAAVAARSPAAVVRHASARLHDLQRRTRALFAPPPPPPLPPAPEGASEGGGDAPAAPAAASTPKREEVERLQGEVTWALQELSLALCDLGDSDAAQGLGKWAAHAFRHVFNFAPPAAKAPADKAGEKEKGKARGKKGRGEAAEKEQESAGAQDQSGADAAAGEGGEGRAAGGQLLWMEPLGLLAGRRFEAAAAHYKMLLNDGAHEAMGAEGVQFIAQRLADTYEALADWRAFEELLAQLQQRRAEAGGAGKLPARAYSLTSDVNRALALARFDMGDRGGAAKHLARTLEVTGAQAGSVTLALRWSEQLHLQAMLQPGGLKSPAAVADLERARALVEAPLRVATLDAPGLAAPLLMQLECARRLQDSAGPSPHSSALIGGRWMDGDHQDPSMWLRPIRAHRAAGGDDEALRPTLLQVVRLCRRLGNLDLARDLLGAASRPPESCPWPRGGGGPAALEETALAPDVLYEVARICYAGGDTMVAALTLWDFLGPVVKGQQVVQSGMNDLVARMCLKLAKWLQQPGLPATTLGPVLHGGPDRGAESMHAMSLEDAGRAVDTAGRTCVVAATCIAPAMAKAWLGHANWCIRSSGVADAAGTGGGGRDHGPAAAQGAPALTEQQTEELSQAVKAYFEYLRIRSSGAGGPGSRGGGGGGDEDGEPVAVMLRLLQIIVRHGEALERPLREGLAATPPAPWPLVIPQLLALLRHHGAAARRHATQLLLPIARLYPFAMVYPAVVETLGGEGEGEEATPDELKRLVGELQREHPKVVAHVHTLVTSLGRVVVLREEIWHSTLQELLFDLQRRATTLRDEVARVNESTTLSAEEKLSINEEKYSVVIAPPLALLDRRIRATLAPGLASTPHEAWFERKYRQDAVMMFKRISDSLGRRLKRANLALDDVAPSLARLQSTLTPLPGLHLRASGPGALGRGEGPAAGPAGAVTVASVHSVVEAISTKTRPKKLRVLGSDGQQYTFLLKGREDLRLDERLMQLLRVTNLLLQSDRWSRERRLTARHYTVTPISEVAGLIEWVPDTTPVFALFAAWQRRAVEAARAAEAAGHPPPKVPQTASTARVGDLFYGCVIPALRAAGVRRAMSRRDWPPEVLRGVLLHLMKETPRTLLARELWATSSSASAWYQKQQCYSRSLALNSIIGHVVGLGDRHLDNILLDNHTGEVVHIDYNVCFEKGRRLKVPEVVPFRLTPNLQAALGPTGVEGAFRAGAEGALRVLRARRGAVLQLLEALVHDPLVEWQREHDATKARRGMELAVSLALFASRVQETRTSLKEQVGVLKATLPPAVDAVQALLVCRGRMDASGKDNKRLHQEMAVLHTQVAKKAAVESELSRRLDALDRMHQVAASEGAQVRSALAEAARECVGWADRHSFTIATLLARTAEEVTEENRWADPRGNLAFQLLPAVTSYRRDAISGIPGEIVARCRKVDAGSEAMVGAVGKAITTACTAIEGYTLCVERLVACPAEYAATSRHSVWADALTKVLKSETVGAVEDALKATAVEPPGPPLDRCRALQSRMDAVAGQVEDLAQELHELEKGGAARAQKEAESAVEAWSSLNERGHEEMAGALSAAAARALAGCQGDIAIYTRGPLPGAALASAARTAASALDALASHHWAPEGEGEGDACDDPAAFAALAAASDAAAMASWRFEMGLPQLEAAGPGLERQLGAQYEELGLVHAEVQQLASAGRALVQRMHAHEASVAAQPAALAAAEVHLKTAEEEASCAGESVSWEDEHDIQEQVAAAEAAVEALRDAWARRHAIDTRMRLELDQINSRMREAQDRMRDLTRAHGAGAARGGGALASICDALSALADAHAALPRDQAGEDDGGGGTEGEEGEGGEGEVGISPEEVPAELDEWRYFVFEVHVAQDLLGMCLARCLEAEAADVGALGTRMRQHLEGYLERHVAPPLASRLASSAASLSARGGGRARAEAGQGGAAVLAEGLVAAAAAAARDTARAEAAREMLESARATQAALRANILSLEWECERELLIASKGRHKPARPDPPAATRSSAIQALRDASAEVAAAEDAILEWDEKRAGPVERGLHEAMFWSCGHDPSLPPPKDPTLEAFSDHLGVRRQLVWRGLERSAALRRLCDFILAFEASREMQWAPPPDPTRREDPFAGVEPGYSNLLASFKNVVTTSAGGADTLTALRQELRTARHDLEADSAALDTARAAAAAGASEHEDAAGSLFHAAGTALTPLRGACAALSAGLSALTGDTQSMFDELLAVTEGTRDAGAADMARQAAALSKHHLQLCQVVADMQSSYPDLYSALRASHALAHGLPPGSAAAINTVRLLLEGVWEPLRAAEAPTVRGRRLAEAAEHSHTGLLRLADAATLAASSAEHLHDAAGSQHDGDGENIIDQATAEVADAGAGAEAEAEEADDLLDGAFISVSQDLSPVGDAGWGGGGAAAEAAEEDAEEDAEAEADWEANADADAEAAAEAAGPAPPTPPRGQAAAPPALPPAAGALGGQGQPGALLPEQGEGAPGSTPPSPAPSPAAPATPVPAPSGAGVGDADGAGAGAGAGAGVGASVRRAEARAHGVQVLERVRQKLSGRDPKTGRAVGVSEAVEGLIRQATSLDNLAQMFEGWAPWV